MAKSGGDAWVASNTYLTIINDDSTDTAKNFYEAMVGFGVSDFILFGGNYFTDFLPMSRCWIVWDKERPKDNFADFEMAWTSYDRPAILYRWLWNGLSRKGDRASEGLTRMHPTQKPVGVMASIITDFAAEDQPVFDGFLGSGTTLIACEQLSRRCYAIEIAPQYVDVAVRRYVEYVGTSENVFCERDEEKIPYTELFNGHSI